MKSLILTLTLTCATLCAAFASDDKDQSGLLQTRYDQPGVARSFVAGKEWFPLPDYNDREAWNSLLGPNAQQFIKQGEKLLDYDWKVIPATAYLAFERTGDRQAMEKPEGANRGALIALTLAELAEGKGRFIDQLANGIWQAAQQTSWVLSAHQSRQRSGRALPDMREHFIDLAAGRFGSIVSIACHFFHDEFDKLDPSITRAAEEAVKRNILDPFLDKDEWRAQWWLGLPASRKAMLNNWTPWCNSDAILCFLLMEKDQERLDRAIAQSVQSMDLFLDYIQKDGACEEGPGYWDAAAGKLYDWLQIMYDASEGNFSVFDNDRIRRMGEFISRAYIGNQYVTNFADAGAKQITPNELIWNYGHAVNSREMMNFALFGLADRQKAHFKNPSYQGNDSYRAMQNVRFNPQIRRAVDSLNTLVDESSMEIVLQNLRKNVPQTTWYPETEMCFMRNPSQWFLGAKGGYNNESHNHNDVGTCVVYIRNIPVLVDAGVGTYTKQTFSKDRYSIWSMQCDWHNLPMINGVAQSFGSEYRARDTRCNPTKGSFSAEIAGAYPDEAACKSWTRAYRLTMNGKPTLTITDTYTLDKRLAPDVEHFLVKGEVFLPGDRFEDHIITPGEILIRCDEGLTVRLSYPRTLKASVDVKELDDPKFTKIWGKSLRRINLTSAADAPVKGRYEFRISEAE